MKRLWETIVPQAYKLFTRDEIQSDIYYIICEFAPKWNSKKSSLIYFLCLMLSKFINKKISAEELKREYERPCSLLHMYDRTSSYEDTEAINFLSNLPNALIYDMTEYLTNEDAPDVDFDTKGIFEGVCLI